DCRILRTTTTGPQKSDLRVCSAAYGGHATQGISRFFAEAARQNTHRQKALAYGLACSPDSRPSFRPPFMVRSGIEDSVCRAVLWCPTENFERSDSQRRGAIENPSRTTQGRSVS